MAKKKQKPAPSRISRKKTIWIVVAALLITLICFFGIRALIHHQQTEAAYKVDKVRFAATEKDLNTAYDAIVAKLGKPYETGHSHVCAYGALEYARGTLNCAIAYQMIYGTKSVANGKALTIAMYNSIRGQYGFSADVFQIPSQTDQIKETFSADFTGTNGMGCSIDYTIWSKQDFNGVVAKAHGYKTYTGQSPKVAVYSFGCNRDVLKALYKIED